MRHQKGRTDSTDGKLAKDYQKLSISACRYDLYQAQILIHNTDINTWSEVNKYFILACQHEGVLEEASEKKCHIYLQITGLQDLLGRSYHTMISKYILIWIIGTFFYNVSQCMLSNKDKKINEICNNYAFASSVEI